MGAALELLTGRVTAPGATITALTANSGNSWTIRNAPLEKKIKLLQCWVDVQGTGTLRIRSPNLHDSVQGLRFATTVGYPCPLLADTMVQNLIPQDTLTVELSGSATAGDIELAALLIWYEDLPGVAANFISPEEALGKIEHVFTVENTLSFGTSGDYTGEEHIATQFDLFKANRNYALLGYTVTTECLCVRWRGSDVGNLGIGGPGEPDLREITRDWFVRLSKSLGQPLIPVFNSANRTAILVDGVQDENAAATTVTSIFALLKE